MNGRTCVFVRANAVRMCTIPVRGLGMNGRACSFVRASAVRMCTVPVLGLGIVAYSLLGGVYGQNLYWACALQFHVCTCGTVFGLGGASSVSCMCVCVRRSACATRALYHSPCVRVCVRCTVYGMVAWAACVVYMSVTCTYVLCVYHLNSVWRG